jgi:polyhydroxyalkanoate synthase
MDVQTNRRLRSRPKVRSDARLEKSATASVVAASSASPRNVAPRNHARRSAPLPPASAEPSFIRDSYSSTALAETIDRSVHAATARFTAGVSPMMLLGAYVDWASHLAFSPGKRLQLVEKAIKKSMRLARYAGRRMASADGVEPCIVPLPQDRRFVAKAWQKPPYDSIYQSFLLTQQWWHNAVTDVRGVTRRDENTMAFLTRQALDIFSPSNFLFTNPEVLARTWHEGGANLLRGYQHFLEDCERTANGHRAVDAFRYRPGIEVAATPGKVVYRNRLIELIQYAPATPAVRAEPVLIVPAWIMKYYILDLSPENSLVKYLTQRGHTVFMISWKNPDPQDRDLGMEDYRTLGIGAAVDAVSSIVPDRKIHAVGYCIGGTLLAIEAATMARDGDQRLASATFFAAQTDFTEAGELMLFTNESQLAFIEDVMWEQGFLDATQMAGAFAMLRSNDLVWSRMVRDYLMGERQATTDLIAWNADTTRMPYRMHSQYLRQLFLQNDFAEGRYQTDGRAVALADLRLPLFVVGTEWDHVAPWQSVYKFHLLTDTEVTFVLTNGGHNAGIVSPPSNQDRHYRIATKRQDAMYLAPEVWLAKAPLTSGSWWPAWGSWLEANSGDAVPPPAMGRAEAGYAPLCDAPGTYVMQP